VKAPLGKSDVLLRSKDGLLSSRLEPVEAMVVLSMMFVLVDKSDCFFSSSPSSGSSGANRL